MDRGTPGSFDPEKAKRHFNRIGMVVHLGYELLEIGEETAQMSLVPDERHQNYLGQLHGGAVATAIDTVAFMPGVLFPSGRKLTTVSFDMHFFKPSDLGERVLFNARILRNGRRMVTLECDAVNERSSKKIAHAIVTLLDMEA